MLGGSTASQVIDEMLKQLVKASAPIVCIVDGSLIEII